MKSTSSRRNKTFKTSLVDLIRIKVIVIVMYMGESRILPSDIFLKKIDLELAGATEAVKEGAKMTVYIVQEVWGD